MSLKSQIQELINHRESKLPATILEGIVNNMYG
jgi:hypothetical protein